MEENSTPRNPYEIPCWIIAALTGYAALIVWAAGGNYLPAALVFALAGLTAGFLDLGEK